MLRVCRTTLTYPGSISVLTLIGLFWLWSHVKHDLSSRHYKCSQWKKPYWSCFHAFQEISKQFLLSLLFFTIISSENHVTRRKLLDGPDAVCNRTKCNYLKKRAPMWIEFLLQCNDFCHPVFGCGYDDAQCDQIRKFMNCYFNISHTNEWYLLQR